MGAVGVNVIRQKSVFGPSAAWLTLISIAAAVGTEYGIGKLRKVPLSITDGSAILTGMLLAFNLPPGVSWWTR